MAWVLFYDGDCAFCSRSVVTVARLDRSARISFAPLQGKFASKHGLSHLAGPDGTMALIRESDSRVFTRSDALIELSRALGGWWRLPGLVSSLIPKPLRDLVYQWIARNRYRFMGKTESCTLPDPELAKRLRD